jgi:flavin reductase (DIM6/NTAB) family NADH-FMN oxidoreductase RutF
MPVNADPTLNIRPSILYFGTPVVLVSTVDADGRVNLTPISSAWALGYRLLLGMATTSQGCINLLAQGEAVINLPGPELHPAVEMIAATTGRAVVPEYKRRMGYRFEPDKFGCAGLSPLPAHTIRPPRVAQCPLQLETRLLQHMPAARHGGEEPGFVTLELEVLEVHAHADIVRPGSQHIDTERWSPLLYVFRHYFSTGVRLGRNFRAED